MRFLSAFSAALLFASVGLAQSLPSPSYKSVTTSTAKFPGSTSGMTTLQPSATASGTLTLPPATDTLVGRNTTDTLTNKSLTSPGISNPTISGNAAFTGTVTGPFRKILRLESYGGGSGADNGPAITSASTACSSLFGCDIVLWPGVRYPVTTSGTLGRNMAIVGGNSIADPGNPFGVTTQYFNYLQNVGALVIGPTASIAVSSGSGITGTYLLASGLALNGTDLPTAYAGTAITAGTSIQNVDGVFVRDSAILGFSTAIRGQNIGRSRFENNLIDANNGFYTSISGDFNRFGFNHLYGVLQAGATGHDTFSLRSGAAFKFDGAPAGGAQLIGNFSYGYNLGVDIGSAGQVVVANHWVDGPTASATGRPLDTTSIGIRTAAVDYIEGQFSTLKVDDQGTAFVIGANTKGITPVSDAILWNNNVGFNVSGYNLVVSNLSMRAYDVGFNFNSKAAANSAKILGGIMFDRNAPGSGLTGIADPIDINAGTGDPEVISVSRTDATLDIRNELRPDIAIVSNVITLPGSQPAVRVNMAGTVTNIATGYDNRMVTVEASGSGLILSGTNFLFSTGTSWTSTQVGASITLRYSRFVNKWVEQSRGPL